MIKKTISILLLALLFGAGTANAQKFHSENLFYVTNNPKGIQSFREHANQISLIVPDCYHIDQHGVISGRVAPKILEIAKKNKVKVMPIIATFDQTAVHQFLHNAKAIHRAITMMVTLGKKYHYYGWQFDLENVNFLDADAYTSFFKTAAKALHKNGFKISMAVVKSYYPFPAPGHTGYNKWAYENWKGAFQIKKLVKIGDFISFMTYDEHTALTPPGPVAGLPWMNKMAKYLKSLNVPMNKISFGLPTYSDHWYPAYNKAKGAHSTRSEISYQQAEALLKKHKAKLIWMPKQGVYYTHWTMPNGIFNWLFLEDARSFKEKLQLIPQYGFRGISVWLLGTEDPGVWKVLKKNTIPTH